MRGGLDRVGAWHGEPSPTRSGSGFDRSCPVRSAIGEEAVRGQTRGAVSKASFGSCGQALPGANCRRGTGVRRRAGAGCGSGKTAACSWRCGAPCSINSTTARRFAWAATASAGCAGLMPLRPKPDCRFRLLCCVVWAEGHSAFRAGGKRYRVNAARYEQRLEIDVMTRSKLSVLCLVGLSVVMLAAYAGAQPGLDVTGTWTGSTSSGANPITLVLQQADNKLTGTLTGAGDNDGNVTGTVQENTVRLRNAKGSIPVLTVRGEKMTGTLSGGTAVTLSRTAK